MKNKKVVYIAHPISGDVKSNIEKILKIVHDIQVSTPDVLAFAPYIVDCLAMDDDNPVHRKIGIENDFFLLRSGIVKELWLFGDRISPGMADGVKLADELGIPVHACTPATTHELNSLRSQSAYANS
jgi:hypothetical protein